MAIIFVALLRCTLLLLASASAYSRVVEHRFEVENLVVKRLCVEQVILAVNGKYPGPTIYVHEGDTVLVHVFNKSPHNITIHWHGVQMLLNGWADGAGYVTQCPILPGHSFTYKFNVTKQEGTLWWHAHLSWFRATVHGAFIIYPKVDRPYPFEEPYEEIPIILGEWFNDTVAALEYKYLHETLMRGIPTAITINGQPGAFYECSQEEMFKLRVRQGKTYLLRIISASLNDAFFFNIANHRMTVVSVDACYTVPYATDVVLIAPGQTVDVLFKTDQPQASYYMTSYCYLSRESTVDGPSNKNHSSGILIYDGVPPNSSIVPISAKRPDFNDHLTAFKFSASIKGLRNGPFWVPVPLEVDEHMFMTMGMGIVPCRGDMGVCVGPYGGIVYGSLNNISFELPTEMSMLEAFYKNIEGVYTTDFPDDPPIKFDYTNVENNVNENLMWIGEVATKVKKLRYNTTVQIVIQNSAIFTFESHPAHLHGYNFHVLAQGFGNYDARRDERKFNLFNSQLRNTIAVPTGGWAVIRFQANNPGVWLFHCHLDFDQSVGIGTAFVVENGPSQETSLPPPPFDLPNCFSSIDDQVVRLPVENSTHVN